MREEFDMVSPLIPAPAPGDRQDQGAGLLGLGGFHAKQTAHNNCVILFIIENQNVAGTLTDLLSSSGVGDPPPHPGSGGSLRGRQIWGSKIIKLFVCLFCSLKTNPVEFTLPTRTPSSPPPRRERDNQTLEQPRKKTRFRHSRKKSFA